MNKENILKLADVIEGQPHTSIDAESGFNMDNWTPPCGTPACICGWANYVRTDGKVPPDHLGYICEAISWLGISGGDGSELFKPNNNQFDPNNWNKITPHRAAAVLRNFAETGEVDWSVEP